MLIVFTPVVSSFSSISNCIRLIALFSWLLLSVCDYVFYRHHRGIHEELIDVLGVLHLPSFLFARFSRAKDAPVDGQSVYFVACFDVALDQVVQVELRHEPAPFSLEEEFTIQLLLKSYRPRHYAVLCEGSIL